MPNLPGRLSPHSRLRISETERTLEGELLTSKKGTKDCNVRFAGEEAELIKCWYYRQPSASRSRYGTSSDRQNRAMLFALTVLLIERNSRKTQENLKKNSRNQILNWGRSEACQVEIPRWKHVSRGRTRQIQTGRETGPSRSRIGAIRIARKCSEIVRRGSQSNRWLKRGELIVSKMVRMHKHAQRKQTREKELTKRA